MKASKGNGTFERNLRSRSNKIEDVPPAEASKQSDRIGETFPLKSWFVRPTKKSTVYIEGTAYGCERGLEEPQNSSAIVRRLDARVLESKTGSVYKLVGPIARNKAIERGVSEDFIRKFRNGFPEDWQSIVEMHYPNSVNTKRRNDSFADACNSFEVTTLSTRPASVSLMDLSWTRSGRMRTVAPPKTEIEAPSLTSTISVAFNEPEMKRRRTDKRAADVKITALCPIVQLHRIGPASVLCSKSASDAACQTDEKTSVDVGCQTELEADTHHDVSVGKRSVAVRRERPKKINCRKPKPLLEADESGDDRPSAPKNIVHEEQVTMRLSRVLRPRIPVTKAPTEKAIEATSKTVPAARRTNRNEQSNRKPSRDEVDGNHHPKRARSRAAPTAPTGFVTAVGGRGTLRFRRRFREFLEDAAHNDDDSDNDMFTATPYRNKCQVEGLASLLLNENLESQDYDDGTLLTPRESLSERDPVFAMMPLSAQKTPNVHSGVTPFVMSVDNPAKRKRDIDRYIWARKKRLKKGRRDVVATRRKDRKTLDAASARKTPKVGTMSPLAMPTISARFIDFGFPSDVFHCEPSDDDEENADDYFSDDC